jgi:hypothetical protein
MGMEDAGAKLIDTHVRLRHLSLATTEHYLAVLKQPRTHGTLFAALLGLARF